MLICVPPMHYVVGGASSMSLGIIAASLLTISLLRIAPRIPKLTGHERWIVLFSGLIFSKGAVDLLVYPSFANTAAFFGFCAVVLAANSFASYLWKLHPFKVRKLFLVVSGLLCALLMMSLFGQVSIHNYRGYTQNVFPFSEPSHFAIFCTPLIAVGILLAGRQLKLILLATLWVGATLLPNLTLAVQAILLSGIYLVSITRRLAILLPVLALLTLAVVIVGVGDVWDFVPTHFVDRLSFRNAENISTLVYLQGWDRTLIALESTFGFGVGFQNLESLESGEFGARLFEVLQFDKNLKDGGFLLSKVVGEFGVFGVGFCIAYLGLFWSALRELVNQIKSPQFRHLHKERIVGSQVEFLRAIGNILVLVFIVEVFVRAVGYFSLGVFLFAVGLFLRMHASKLHTHLTREHVRRQGFWNQ